MDKIYIIDSSGYIFRAFYAITNLTTKSGFPTNALYGFLKMYIKLLKEADPKYIVSVFDTGEKNFRHALYPEYKANRAKCPDELSVQMPFFRDFVNALGIKVLEKVGFEADDIIATVSDKASSLNMSVEIVSADKDLMQLVGGNVSIFDTMKDKHYDKEEVKAKFGIYPEKIRDYLALVGDSSDNVPGIKGLGPKTATLLLENYENIDKVYSSLSTIENDKSIRGAKSLVKNLLDNKETLLLSKKLVSLERNVPLNFDNKDFENFNIEDFKSFFKKDKLDDDALSLLIEKFEFQSLFKSFLEDKLSSSNVNINTKKEISNDCTNDCSNNYEVKTIFKDDIKDFISLLQKQKFFAFDVETTSLDIFKAKIVGVSFCFDNDKAYYVPLLHEVIFSENKQISVEEFIKLIKDILENDNIKKTGHNLKFDIEIFKNHGVDVLGIVFDSMIASYLLNPDDVSFSLSRVVKKYLGHDCIEYKDVVGKKKNFSEVDIETASKYSAEDAYFSFILYLKLNDELTKKDLLKVFYEIDLPLLNVLATMELNGVYIDTQQLRKSSMFFAKELEILEQEIYELAGSTFNINSPKQLSYILFEKLNISTAGLKKTQFGFSTDVNTLEKLKNIHPIAEKLLKYRGIFKLKSTYLDALPEFVSSKTNRLHTRYNQAGTGTGRLSSSDPNLQNIPIKTLEGRKIRSAFLAPSEKVIISADYSQVELRVLAHMSKDKTLIEAFNKGEDIHTKTAKFIFELKATDTPTQEQRRFAKVINFGLIYGMSAYGLSNELSISVQTAKKYIDGFFNKYFGVKEYFDKLLKDVESLGYVSTMFGRKRFVSSLFSDNKNKGYLNRMAINAPIQGTAADIIKLAMISIHNEIIDRNLKLKMILQIHDELVFECDESFKDEAISFIKTQMESITLLDVPLKVDVGSGASWEDAH